MTDDRLYALACQVADLAHEAGEAILEVYAGEIEVQTKADSSPLTQADLASEKAIVAGLKQLTPEVPVIAEESAEVPYQERRNWTNAWLVDPLDGTKEFVKRNGEFTVNIAMVEDGRPVLGVVHAPVLGVTYFAARGRGAFRRDEEGEKRIEVRAPEGATLHVVMSRSHANEATQRFLQRAQRQFRVEAVSKGSALKMCLVAAGDAHVYPRLGPTMEWDVAAAQCVVEQAGGQLVTLDGNAMVFNRPDLLNPSFLACYGEADRWLKLLGE